MTLTPAVPAAALDDPVTAQAGEVVVVHNPSDDPATARQLAVVADPHRGRVVVRPTPGAKDLLTLGLDLMMAAGKNPTAARTEKVCSTGVWEHAYAWMRGAAVTDLIIDRAHRLTPEQITALHQFAACTRSRLWLIWSGSDQPALGGSVQHLTLAEFLGYLPPLSIPPPQGAAEGWPVLPACDFPTFLAEAGRLLPGQEFTRVTRLYDAAAKATQQWLGQRGFLLDPVPGLQVYLQAALAGWLRDHMLGPAPAAPAALITPRAVQAALFPHGIWLAWDAQALGPDPARRLQGDLTPTIAVALHTMCRTDLAAATVLSLHLNHEPADFDLLCCSDIAPDGSTVWGRRRGSALVFAAYTSGSYSGKWGLRTTTRAFDEIDTEDAIVIPRAARPILAAHLALRRQGARDHDPYFTHPTDPGARSPAACLHEGITRTCRRLGLQTPWMHRGTCKYDTDIGGRRDTTWMGERGLTTTYLHPPVTQPPPPGQDDELDGDFGAGFYDR